jgi:hypothetical protein
VSEVREGHPTGCVPLSIPCLGRCIIILIHLIKERVLIIEPAHIPLFLDVIDVHLDVETLVELLPRDVVGCPGELGVGPLPVHQAQSLRRPRLLLRLVEAPV